MFTCLIIPVKLSNVSVRAVQEEHECNGLAPHRHWSQKAQDQQTYAIVPNHQWIIQQWHHLANVPIWSMTPYTNDSFSQWPPFTNDPKQPMPPYNQWPLLTNNPIQPMSPFSDPHSPMTQSMAPFQSMILIRQWPHSPMALLSHLWCTGFCWFVASRSIKTKHLTLWFQM